MLDFLDLSGQVVAILHHYFVGLDRDCGGGQEHGQHDSQAGETGLARYFRQISLIESQWNNRPKRR
jgi:hypothetical protein